MGYVNSIVHDVTDLLNERMADMNEPVIRMRMFHRRSYVALLFLLTVSVVSATGSEDLGSEEEEASMEVSVPAQNQAGHAVMATITIRSDLWLMILEPSPFRSIQFSVTDDSGEVVPFTARGRKLVEEVGREAGGANAVHAGHDHPAVININMAKYYDFSLPGLYHIDVTVKCRIDGNSPETLRTGRIEVSVTDVESPATQPGGT